MKDQPKEKVKQPTAEDFAREYQLLCERMGYRIVVNPAWVGTNHGSFEMVLQYSIGPLPKKEWTKIR